MILRMILQDRIFGQIKIDDPLVLEIISTPSFVRLKKIDQAGYPALYHNPKNLPLEQLRHDRYEHSLGVFILLKNYGAPFLEQIAGLIHDLSHGVFSHCLDYAVDGGSEKEQSYQDEIFTDFFKKTQMPQILRKYKINADEILKREAFPLLEKPLPDLCADRLDYSLRTAIIFREANKEQVDSLLNNLVIRRNRWVFKNLKSAQGFARLFCKMNRNYYAGLASARMFRTMGDLIKYGLQKTYISRGDLYKTDEMVLQKLKKKAGKDGQLRRFLERINDRSKTINSPKDFDVQVYCKSRIVDPLFLDEKKIRRLSEAEKRWKEVVGRELRPKLYCLKFLN